MHPQAIESPFPRNGVTIGIPVYNEEARIERAIRSAAHQCERVIVADNASTDATDSICRRLAGELSNVEYFRHEKNWGSLENWYFLIEKVTSPYFMTLGSHDYIDENFIETLKRLLDKDPTIALAAGGLFYDYDHVKTGAPAGDDSFSSWAGGMNSDSSERVRSFLYSDANLPWAMYGLFRTTVYQQFFTRDLPKYGVDFVFLARVASCGKIAICRDARYYAWVRDVPDTRLVYFERLSGSKEAHRSQKLLRNQTRFEIYKLLLQVEKPQTVTARFFLRFNTMARFGVFKKEGIDLAFYFLYFPAKVSIERRRQKRRSEKKNLNSKRVCV